MKINNIFSQTKLKNGEFFQFHCEFRALIESYGAETLKIKPQFEAWIPLYDLMDEGYKKINKSSFTLEIGDKDKLRDDTYLSMLDINKAMLRHFKPEKADAARRLKIVFDTYGRGKVAKKAYNEQTSAMHNMLQELKGKYAPHVATVGLDEWVEELEKRNNDLAELIRERFGEMAQKSDVNLRKAREDLDKQYRVIVERINALVIVEGPDTWEQFIKTLNVIIAKYMTNVAKRVGNNKRKSDGE